MSQAHRTLVLYKRHTPRCHVHTSRVPKKLRHSYYNCECPIYITGRTPDGFIVHRTSTGFSDLKEAEAYRDSIIREHSPIGDEISGPGVAECIKQFQESKATEISEQTQYHYEMVLERLRTFLEQQGVFYIRKVTVDHLEAFKTQGMSDKARGTSRALYFQKVRSFLRDCYRRGWITEPMVERVRNIRASQAEQTDPYSEDEVDRIKQGAETGVRRKRAVMKGYGKYPGTFRLLLELMLETGMRVSDAVSFDPGKLQEKDTMWSYTFKPVKHRRDTRRKEVTVYLTDGLKCRIDGCEWISKRGPFWHGTGTDPKIPARAVYWQMKAIGEEIGITDCRPHRLRDTFAERFLVRGTQLQDVSRLLGHSSITVTERHYAKWIPEREDRLAAIAADVLLNPNNNTLGNEQHRPLPLNAAGDSLNSSLTPEQPSNRVD